MSTQTQKALTLSSPLFVRNLARDPESRVARRLRPGNKLGFLLDDGRRIRRAGVRPTQVLASDLVQNLDAIVEGVKQRYIEVVTEHGRVLNELDLISLALRLLSPAAELTQVNSEAVSEEEPWSPELLKPEPMTPEALQAASDASEAEEVTPALEEVFEVPGKAPEPAKAESKTLNLGGRRKGR